MDKIITSGENNFSENENLDYISENIFEENQIIRDEIQRRRTTMVGLGTFYLFLTIISIVVLV